MNKTFDAQDVNTNKTLAIVMAIIPILSLLPLISADMKKSAYILHTANTTLIVFIFAAITSLVGWIFSLFGFIGMLIGGIIGGLLGVVLFICYVINLINTVQANGKSLSVVGDVTIIK